MPPQIKWTTLFPPLKFAALHASVPKVPSCSTRTPPLLPLVLPETARPELVRLSLKLLRPRPFLLLLQRLALHPPHFRPALAPAQPTNVSLSLIPSRLLLLSKFHLRNLSAIVFPVMSRRMPPYRLSLPLCWLLLLLHSLLLMLSRNPRAPSVPTHLKMMPPCLFHLRISLKSCLRRHVLSSARKFALQPILMSRHRCLQG